MPKFFRRKVNGKSKARKGSKAVATMGAVRRLIGKRNESNMNVAYFTASSNITPDGDSGGFIVDISSVAQGDAEGTRQSNSVRLRNIEIGYFLSGGVGTTQTTVAPQLRVMIVQKMSSDVALASTDLFVNSANMQDVLLEHTPTWNLRNLKVTKVWHDKSFCLRTLGSAQDAVPPTLFISTDSNVISENIHLGKDGILATYDGTVATNRLTNTFYLVVLSQTATQYINYFIRTVYSE